MELEEIPEWFWEVLDATRPRLSALASWLESQPREVLEAYALAYGAAMCSLADFSQGVRVDGVVWSEDDTEDLCAWVVGQGRGFWHPTVAGQRDLAEVAQAYLGRVSPFSAEVTPWDTGVSNPEHRGYQSPGAIVQGVYRTCFAQSLHDRLPGVL